MPHVDPPGDPGPSKFRRTLVRVLIVQIVALAALAVLQLHYRG
jgi:hypothetical protein